MIVELWLYSISVFIMQPSCEYKEEFLLTEQIIEFQLPNSPDPILYHYYKGLQNRTFYINAEIDSDLVDMVAMPLLAADREDPEKPITIYINTVGGSVFDGFNLCDIIRSLQSPTQIIVLGYAYSMGAFLLMAGANKSNITRKCFHFSTGLMHGGSSFIQGTASQVKDYYKFAERFEEKIEAFVLENTNFTKEEYDKIERQELYMTAEDMLEKGLVDEIVYG